jgi:hypothetical protein
MKKQRFSVEQIVAVLKQAKLGLPVADLIRQVGISEQTFYRWKRQYPHRHNLCYRIRTRDGFACFLPEHRSSFRRASQTFNSSGREYSSLPSRP